MIDWIRNCTVTEILVYLVVGAVLFGLLCLGLVRCGATSLIPSKEVATHEAKVWAEDMGMDIKGVSCVRFDTDGDGYVSCTLMGTNGNVYIVECASALTFNSGCRTPKTSLVRPTTGNVQ